MRVVSNAVLMVFLSAALPAVARDRPAVGSGELQVEQARVSVHIDPEAGAILGKVLLTLRNRSGTELAALNLRIPAPYGAAAKVNVVWDRNEELPWRRLVTAETRDEFHLQVPLTRLLGKGKKVIVGVSFEVHLRGREQYGTRVERDNFVLMGTGWYPLPAAEGRTPGRVRLSVRLPNGWKLTGPLKGDRKHKGLALSEYEVKYDGEAADRVVFSARAPGVD